MISSRLRVMSLCLAVGAGLGLLAARASAELVAKLPQVMDPFFVTIADGRMYIVENDVTVHIFTLDPEGVSFVKTFGREGQGPGEFDFIFTVRPFKDHLDIPGSNKLARFSLDGDYVGEVPITIGFFKGAFYRLGDRYLARDLDFDEKGTITTIRLYDKDLKLLKEIGARTSGEGLMKPSLVSDYYAARVVGDEIYVVDAGRDEPVAVTVYDRNGTVKRTIVLALEPVKMTAALKEAVIKPVRDGWSKSTPTPWAEYEKRLVFPDRAPGLDYFDVYEGKLIARTWKYRQDKVEFAVFDLQGRELRRMDLPFTGRPSNGTLFCFGQGRFFYLRENPGEEVWELHAEKAW